MAVSMWSKARGWLLAIAATAVIVALAPGGAAAAVSTDPGNALGTARPIVAVVLGGGIGRAMLPPNASSDTFADPDIAVGGTTEAPALRLVEPSTWVVLATGLIGLIAARLLRF